MVDHIASLTLQALLKHSQTNNIQHWSILKILKDKSWWDMTSVRFDEQTNVHVSDDWGTLFTIDFSKTTTWRILEPLGPKARCPGMAKVSSNGAWDENATISGTVCQKEEISCAKYQRPFGFYLFLTAREIDALEATAFQQSAVHQLQPNSFRVDS